MENRPQNLQYTYPTLTVYGNSAATKKFPIKTLLKLIDFNVKNLGKVEYDNKNSSLAAKIEVRVTSYCTVHKSVRNRKVTN